MNKKLVFLCGARDFHAMDWYRSALNLLPNAEICILTDLIAGEEFKILINDNDKVYKLLILDKFLFPKQSKLGNIWRNFIKLIAFPIQILLIKKFAKTNPYSVYHAHSMYYLWLAWIAGVPFVGTPQGSDILIKPHKSKIYKYFSKQSLKAARAVTVDSIAMKNGVKEISGVDAYVIQNGIDIESIFGSLRVLKSLRLNRTKVLSIRGFTPLYRIKALLDARNTTESNCETPITFIYPFHDTAYRNEIYTSIKPFDIVLGRVDRIKMYELLSEAKLVISIPYSDSSPRSVYEAIFCGCAVAVSYHPYFDALPQCMKPRIIIVDLGKKGWFDEAVSLAEKIVSTEYKPSEKAIKLYDQKLSFKLIEQLLFQD